MKNTTDPPDSQIKLVLKSCRRSRAGRFALLRLSRGCCIILPARRGSSIHSSPKRNGTSFSSLVDTKSKPSEAGSIWRGRRNPSVRVAALRATTWPIVSFVSVKPNRSPAKRVRFGEEEGRSGYAVFAALSQTAKTEWSEFLLTTTGCSAVGSARGLGP